MITRIEYLNSIYFKREDSFTYFNVCGGKVRSALKLCEGEHIGFTTAGSKQSPQIQIISEIAKHKKIPFVAHCPSGKLTKEIEYAMSNGATILQHRMGFNNNIICKAKEYSKQYGFTYIPFGMDDKRCVEENTNVFLESYHYQLQYCDFDRIVLAVGSGITLCGILNALKILKLDIPIIGIIIGKNPISTINKYCENISNLILLEANVDYHKKINCNLHGIDFDPIYEAKAVPFLRKNDLFWIIGRGIR